MVLWALDFSPSHGDNQREEGFYWNASFLLLLLLSEQSSSHAHLRVPTPPHGQSRPEGADHQSGHPAMYSLVFFETWMKLLSSHTLTSKLCTWYNTCIYSFDVDIRVTSFTIWKHNIAHKCSPKLTNIRELALCKYTTCKFGPSVCLSYGL